MTSPDEIRVETDENELSLRDIAEVLPDTTTIMRRIGDCWWRLIYAARASNWELAAYHLKQVGKLEDALKVLRPKHQERLERFQVTALAEVVAAVEAESLDDLEAAFAAATDLANEMHTESGYHYIQWELPDEPPVGLRLAPKETVTTDGQGPR